MATSSSNVPRIVHVGPGLAVRGGVSAVERLIIDSISRHVQVEHVATAKMAAFCAACGYSVPPSGASTAFSVTRARASFMCTSPRVEAHSASASSP